MPSPSLSVRVVALGLVLGIVGTALTFHQMIGLGFTLFSLVLLSALPVFAVLQHIQPVRRTLVMLVPAVFFTVMLSIRSDASLTMLNIGAAISALLLTICFFRYENILKQNIIEYPLKVLLTGIAVWVQPFSEVSQSAKWVSKHQGSWRAVIPVVRGLLITLPVLAVFVILLSAADEVFSRLVSGVLSAFSFRNLNGLTEQLFFVGVYSWVTVGGLAVALIERKVKRAPPRPRAATPQSEPGIESSADDSSNDTAADAATPAPAAPAFGLGFTESAMLLGSIGLVFAAFVAIQFVYLFGGERNISNYSYADYVHRGFIELVLVAVLTLGLELALNTISIRRTPTQSNIIRGLSTVLIMLTAVILVSAFQRMRLYELTYGLTSLRLLIYVFIVWLGFAFGGFTLSLYWTPLSINVFSVTALIAVFGFAATLDILNPDYYVAWQNINRGNVDPLQLSVLSEEAAPALVSLVDAPDPGLRNIVRYTLYMYSLKNLSTDSDWRSFNLDRRNLTAVLDSVQNRLTNAELLAGWNAKHTLNEFSSLHHGMTVREVVRQLGFPYQRYARSDLYGDFSRLDNNLTLTYSVEDSRTLYLKFDTAAGLISYCVQAQKSECSPLPLAP